MAIPRNIKEEQRAIGQFMGRFQREPKTPEEWAQVHKMAYGENLPDEFKQSPVPQSPPESLAVPGSLNPPANTLPQTPETSDIGTLKQRREEAYKAVQNTEYPRVALNALQDAIKLKTQPYNLPLGESEVFQKAGVGGYGALSASLGARSDELKMYGEQFSDQVTKMAGLYGDRAKAAALNYKTLSDEYNAEANRLQKIQDNLVQQQQQMELLKEKYKWEEQGKLLDAKIDAGLINPETDQPYTALEKSGKIGGSVSWRNNNPYNIKFGDFAKQYGAEQGTQATDGGYFAYFPDEATGEQAAKDLLKSSNYANLTVDQAMKKWSGGGYDVTSMEGLSSQLKMTPIWGGKKVKDLTDTELSTLMGLMKNREGWTVGTMKGGISDEKQVQLKNLIIRLAGKYKQEEAIKTYNSLAGNPQAQENYLNVLAVESMPSNIKTDYSLFGNVLGETTGTLAQIQNFEDTKYGFWKTAIEKAKPFVELSKDKNWVDLTSTVSQLQAKYRNLIYGASLTGNELKDANYFLSDFSKDDIGTVKVKLESMRDFASRLRKRYINEQKGISVEGQIPEKSTQQTYTKADEDYVKGLNLK